MDQPLDWVPLPHLCSEEAVTAVMVMVTTRTSLDSLPPPLLILLPLVVPLALVLMLSHLALLQWVARTRLEAWVPLVTVNTQILV